MAQSSCETEMIALMDLANYQRRASKEVLGDNIASLAIYGWTATNWRFQGKYHEASLPAHHIAGEWNAADLGTKAFGGLGTGGSATCWG